jgi:hypothetical protein
MEERPELRPRPELLQPDDLAMADEFVAHVAPYDVPPGDLARLAASMVAHRMVETLGRGIDASPEAAACRAMAVVDLMITKWEQHRDRTMN